MSFINKSNFFKYIILGIIILFSVYIYNAKNNGEVLASNNNFLSNKLNLKQDLSNLKKTKVIIIGDSRFEFIINDKEDYKIPVNFSFIAKTAMEVKWFKEIAVKELDKKLANMDPNISYNVVVNMGVNDIQFYRPFEQNIKDYISEYKKLINKYPTVKFYIMSINPVDEEKASLYSYKNIRTNADIEYFNNKIIDFINNSDKKNIYYCPADKVVSFKTDDGLHYKVETSQDILNYIANDCVDHNKRE